MNDEIIVLDVGGTKFKTFRSTLSKMPESKLGQLASGSYKYAPDNKTHFFDRNPELFNVILDLYRCNELKIHPPGNVCGHVLLRELEYWEIPIDSISECCLQSYYNYKSEQKVRNDLTIQENKIRLGKTFQQRAWLFFDQPRSSKHAMAFFVFFMAMVLLSALTSCLIPEPSLRDKLPSPIRRRTTPQSAINATIQLRNRNNVSSDPLTDIITPPVNSNRSIKVDLNWKFTLLIATRPKKVLQYLEAFTNSFFVVELLLHFVFCQKKGQFLDDNNNKIDVIVFVVTVVSYSAVLLEDTYMFYPDFRQFFVITNAIVMIKMLRVFRLTKIYTELLILMLSLRTSIKELILLLITFGIFSLIFGNLIYYSELSQTDSFPDVFSGIWWAVVTMTTVGYGDEVPKSSAGYITGVVTSISGLLILAMPIAIIARNFDDYNKVYNNRSTKHKDTVYIKSCQRRIRISDSSV